MDLTSEVDKTVPVGVILDLVEEYISSDIETDVYVVQGRRGTYSPTGSFWMVACYLDEAAAQSLCQKLNDCCYEHTYDKPSSYADLSRGFLSSGAVAVLHYSSGQESPIQCQDLGPVAKGEKIVCPLDGNFVYDRFSRTVYEVKKSVLRLTCE